MRHVDEGTIHAWLDGQVSDPAEAAWIERHCRACQECGARLADERATLAQADALLSSVAPAADAGRPAYDALVARAERSSSSGSTAPSAAPPRFRTWQLAAGWAASVALAAALGWMVRDDWRGEDTPSQLASREITERPVADPESPAASAAAPAVRSASAPGSAAPPPAADRATSEPAQRRSAAPQEAASAGPVTDAPARLAQPAAEPFTETAESAVRSAMPAPAAETPGVSDTAVPYRTQSPVPQFPPEPAGVAPRPVAAPPPPLPGAAPAAPPPSAGSGRGGRGGGGGGGGTGTGTGTGTGAPPPIVDPDSTRTFGVEFFNPVVPSSTATERLPPQGGRIMVDGMSLASRADVGAAQSIAWRQMPRTEAAARTGMALYGITGLASSMTMLSADGSIVRTIYETEGGQAIEIWQQRTPSPAAAGRGGQTLNRATDTFTGSWTATYGDVQVTLRGGADVASWGERLRVE
jgi:hypothetical protein